MKKVYLRKHINENVGNIFANSPSEFPGQQQYSYELLNFDRRFEQKGNSLDPSHYINVGSYIEGYGYDDRETLHRGVVRSIVKDEEGYIKYLIILDSKITKFVKIYPEFIKLLK
jgi:hypothetical protein